MTHRLLKEKPKQLKECHQCKVRYSELLLYDRQIILFSKDIIQQICFVIFIRINAAIFSKVGTDDCEEGEIKVLRVDHQSFKPWFKQYFIV